MLRRGVLWFVDIASGEDYGSAEIAMRYAECRAWPTSTSAPNRQARYAGHPCGRHPTREP
jgi:hypothetical protein